jgi:hypothetical protein
MFPHPVIRRRIPQPLVQSRGSSQVAEEDGNALDGDLVAGAEDLVGEEVAEEPEGGEAVGGEGVLDPGSLLEDEGEGLLRGVEEGEGGGLAWRGEGGAVVADDGEGAAPASRRSSGPGSRVRTR